MLIDSHGCPSAFTFSLDVLLYLHVIKMPSSPLRTPSHAGIAVLASPGKCEVRGYRALRAGWAEGLDLLALLLFCSPLAARCFL